MSARVGGARRSWVWVGGGRVGADGTPCLGRGDCLTRALDGRGEIVAPSWHPWGGCRQCALGHAGTGGVAVETTKNSTALATGPRPHAPSGRAAAAWRACCARVSPPFPSPPPPRAPLLAPPVSHCWGAWRLPHPLSSAASSVLVSTHPAPPPSPPPLGHCVPWRGRVGGATVSATATISGPHLCCSSSVPRQVSSPP